MMDDPKTYWLDEPRNVGRIYWTVCALCAALFIADAFYHKHTHFGVESWFGFYGIYGFVACVGLVLVAKLLRIVLIRAEDYYDD